MEIPLKILYYFYFKLNTFTIYSGIKFDTEHSQELHEGRDFPTL